MLLLGIGAVRLVPVLIRPLSTALSPLVARVSRVGGRVAVQHLVAERTRSANTLALVMLVMAMTVAILAIYSSFTTSLDRQLRVTLGDALSVEAAGTFDDEFVAALDDVDGVAATTPGRRPRRRCSRPPTAADEALLVSAIDPATYFDVATLPFTEGVGGRRASAGSPPAAGVVIPTGLADRHDLHVGDEMVLHTIEGEAPLRGGRRWPR